MKLKNSDLFKPNALQSRPHHRGDWSMDVENDVGMDIITAPGAWANHHQVLKPGAMINVQRLDRSLDVDLRVIKSEPGLVYVRVLREFVDNSDLASAMSNVTREDEQRVPSGYKIGFAPRGEKPGHFVHLQATGDAVARGLGSRREAIKFARKHFTESNPGADPDAEDEAVVKAA